MASRYTYILQVAGADVEVERRAVRRINLRVRPDGSVRMSVPWRVGRAEAQAFLDAHAAWVERARERCAKKAEAASEAEDGRVMLWGKKAEVAPGTDVAALYRAEVASALPAVVASIESACGLHASGWQLRDMKTRWGSCTPATGRIRINIRLAAYDPVCLDYVVAHELTHLAEPSHNARFHALLDAAFPEADRARKLLRRPPAPE
ncbi:SprT family zinc-dependent metalloprotease [Paratractidigestivibacter sp.]|uniref:M48 family metallopeptidase n=1 Tax=Paratractidigestivibacter sp. TaxID=2847316 RepID=UPI002AC9A5B9|nr:SprT family zinc-dependent metalloprotease [Paratractidigestivibacter sp.]